MPVFIAVGAFDVDGTLFHHDSKPDYLDAGSLRRAKPDVATCIRVRTLIEVGVDIHFITGRCNEVRDVTLEQLRRYVHPNILPSRLHTQDVFVGYEPMATWKASRLLATGAEWYVGDHEADKKAASMAGIPFQFAQEYQNVAAEGIWSVAQVDNATKLLILARRLDAQKMGHGGGNATATFIPWTPGQARTMAAIRVAKVREFTNAELAIIERIAGERPGITTPKLRAAYNASRGRRGLPPVKVSRFCILTNRTNLCKVLQGASRRGGTVIRWSPPAPGPVHSLTEAAEAQA